MLKRREECETYLKHVCRHRWSKESPVKRWNIRSFQPNTMAFISCEDRLTKQGEGGEVRVEEAEWGYWMSIPGFNPESLLVSTFDNLTRLPPSLLPFYPLAAPANTLVSLRLQLMKATMLAESSLNFIFSLGSLCYSDVYKHVSGSGRTLPFFLTFFIITARTVVLSLRIPAQTTMHQQAQHWILSLLTDSPRLKG